MKGSFRIVGADGQDIGRSNLKRPWLILYGMAAVFAVMAVVFHFVAGAVAGDAALLAAEGTPAEATVVDRRIVETRDKDKDGFTRTRQTFYLTIAFTPAEAAAPVETEVSVPRERYDSLGNGATVGIFYAPSRPTLIEFTRGETAQNAGIFRWISYGLALSGLGLLVFGVSLRRRMLTPDGPAV